MGVLYILEDDVYISRDGGRVRVSRRRGRDVLLEKPLIAVDEIVIMGNAVVTPAVLQACVERKTGIHYVTKGGTYYACLAPVVSKNAPARVAQFRAHLEPTQKLELAKQFVITKVQNSQVFIRRSVSGGVPALNELALRAGNAQSVESLRGFEGNAAAAYYKELANCLPEEFEMSGRNRRPPRDPVNSLLSLSYTFLSKECLTAVRTAGLDPYVGYLHETKYGKPALALDLMEEFRAILSDSVTLSLLNKRTLTLDDFTDERGYPSLTREGFVKFLKAWEDRMNTRVHHQRLSLKLTYRQVLVAQTRLLAKHLLGELDSYPPFRAR